MTTYLWSLNHDFSVHSTCPYDFQGNWESVLCLPTNRPSLSTNYSFGETSSNEFLKPVGFRFMSRVWSNWKPYTQRDSTVPCCGEKGLVLNEKQVLSVHLSHRLTCDSLSPNLPTTFLPLVHCPTWVGAIPVRGKWGHLFPGRNLRGLKYPFYGKWGRRNTGRVSSVWYL